MRASFVHNRRRARLFDLWTFMVLIVLLFAALVLVFPRQLSLRATDYIDRPSAVSLAYLQALVRAYPEDGWLRLELARQYREVGQFLQARAVLKPLATGGGELPPDLAEQVRWLQARLERDHMFTLPVGSPLRARLQRSLTERLHALAASNAASAGDLDWLAETALSLNQPRVAADVYRRLAGMAGQDRADHLMAAGRWYTASDAPAEAVESYRAVVEGPAPEAQRRASAAALVGVWFGAGEPRRALRAAAELLEVFPGDDRLLELAQRAALESGRPEVALAYARQRWPDRAAMAPAALRERMRLEMGAGRTADAAATAEALVSRLPADVDARRQLARLLEWSGRPRAALTQWLWLRRHGAGDGREPPIWQLALDLYEFETAQRILLDHLDARALTMAELEALRWATAQAGEPDAVVAALQAAAADSRADAAHWRYWLALLMDTGRHEAWLRQVAAFAERFPVDTALRVTWARTLMDRGRWREALSVLDAGRPPDGATAAAYWHAVADAAMTLEDLDRSAAAYEAILEGTDAPDTEAARRLLALSVFLGRHAQSLDLAERLWGETGDPYFLVVALRSAEALGRDSYIRNATAPVPEPARGYVEIWRFLARYHQERGAMGAAGKAYRRALTLSPEAADLQAAYIWYLIDTDQRDLLERRLLQGSGGEASGDLAAALAAGYQALGRHREALIWYGREARNRRGEWLWLLGYADALEDAGYPPAAYRLRRYVLRGLIRRSRDLSTSESVARASLVHDILGPVEGYGQVPARADSAVWLPLLVGWYLDSEMDMAARRSLLAAQRARLSLPGWQRLGLALRDNDLDRIEALLSSETRLSLTDRAVAQERLGRDAQALALAQEAVDGEQAGDGSARALATALSSRLALGAQVGVDRVWSDDAHRLALDARLRLPVGEGVATADLNRSETVADDLFARGAIVARDLTVGWEDGGFGRRWSVAAGVGTRQGRARPSVSLSMDRSLRAGLSTALTLQWNRPPEASLVLDAVTAYRGAGLEGQWNLTERTAASGRLRYGGFVDWWAGGTVAEGADGSLGVSEVIWAGPVRWQVSLGMDWQAYERASNPGAGFDGRLVDDIDGDSLLLERTRLYRVGTRWQHGEPGSLGGRATWPRWHLDVGAGWQVPQDELLLSLDAAVGWPVLGGDEVAFRARYSDNARVAGGFQAGAGLTYTYWFGQ